MLDFDDVLERFERMMDWLAGVYVNAMNIIHYMHDKYSYERLEMALHDYAPLRTMAFGMAGMSVVADSLSAISYAKVRVVRDATGLVTDYQTEGTLPGVRQQRQPRRSARHLDCRTFMNKLRKYPTYRNAVHTQSILTITSNVVYGKATGNTPDGRRKGEPFAPGANPMHGRDSHGIHASAASVAKIPYRDAADGISLTTTLVPEGLGRVAEDRVTNLTGILDAFFGATGYHMNVNVLNRDTLLDAMDHPEKYPNLTIRVSGYAVNFVRLTREQQMDVINRTFHGSACQCLTRTTSRADAARGEEPVRAARQPRPECSGVGRSKRTRVGRHGIPAFLHDRIGRRRSRRARRRMDDRLHVALSLLPQPRHVDHDERHSGHGRESDRGVEEIPHRLQVMSGGLTVSGGEPLMQHRFVVKLLTAAKAMGIHTRSRPTATTATG